MNEDMLSFHNDDNTEIYIELYNIIAELYPIGLYYKSDTYQSNPKFTQYKNIINNRDRRKYPEWERLKEELVRTLIPYEVSLYNFPKSFPSCAIRILKKDVEYEEISYTQQFYILHSLIAPYYTMYGVDSVSVNEKDQMKSRFRDKITIEPVNEYAELFIKVNQIAKKHLINSSFVPVKVLMHAINGLELPYLTSHQKVNFFQALFGTQLFKKSLNGISNIDMRRFM